MAVSKVFNLPVGAWSDIDPTAIKVMNYRLPGILNLGDVKTINPFDIQQPTILTAGYPCQPFSSAGLKRGFDDPRHIWPWISRIIGLVRPRLIVLENVDNHLRIGFPTVLKNLAENGYDAVWEIVPASAVGAPHRRRRLFVLAYDNSQGWQRSGYTKSAGFPIIARMGSESANTPDSRRSKMLTCNPFSEPSAAPSEPRQKQSGRCDSVASVTTNNGWIKRGAESTGEQRGFDSTVSFGTDWGKYSTAVHLWESLLGRSAPNPCITGSRGGRTLNPRLSEWVMGLPDGWVTDVPGISHTAAKATLGSGVVPQQAEYALHRLISYAGLSC